MRYEITSAVIWTRGTFNPARPLVLTHGDLPGVTLTVTQITVGWHWTETDGWLPWQVSATGNRSDGDITGLFAYSGLQQTQWPSLLRAVVVQMEPNASPADLL